MKLIDEARQWHRLWSNRVGMFAGVAVFALVADPALLAQFTALAPEGWRPLLAALSGLFVSSSLIGARMARQTKLRQP